MYRRNDASKAETNARNVAPAQQQPAQANNNNDFFDFNNQGFNNNPAPPDRQQNAMAKPGGPTKKKLNPFADIDESEMHNNNPTNQQ